MTPDVLHLFDAAELARSLKASGHDVSERTVQRWCALTVTPKPQDLAAIRRLLGQPERPVMPEWAERLMAGVMALETKGGVSDEELAKAEARAAAWAAFAAARKQPRRGGAAARGTAGA